MSYWLFESEDRIVNITNHMFKKRKQKQSKNFKNNTLKLSLPAGL